jgi:hypothetical protein
MDAKSLTTQLRQYPPDVVLQALRIVFAAGGDGFGTRSEDAPAETRVEQPDGEHFVVYVTVGMAPNYDRCARRLPIAKADELLQRVRDLVQRRRDVGRRA